MQELPRLTTTLNTVPFFDLLLNRPLAKVFLTLVIESPGTGSGPVKSVIAACFPNCHQFHFLRCYCVHNSRTQLRTDRLCCFVMVIRAVLATQRPKSQGQDNNIQGQGQGHSPQGQGQDQGQGLTSLLCIEELHQLRVYFILFLFIYLFSLFHPPPVIRVILYGPCCLK